jgi:hypothetical protein
MLTKSQREREKVCEPKITGMTKNSL